MITIKVFPNFLQSYILLMSSTRYFLLKKQKITIRTLLAKNGIYRTLMLSP